MSTKRMRREVDRSSDRTRVGRCYYCNILGERNSLIPLTKASTADELKEKEGGI
jgi:hypothetical protein